MECDGKTEVVIKIAPIWKRFVSFILDTIIFMPIYMLFLVLVHLSGAQFDKNIMNIFFSLLFYLYLISSWVGMKGQTIGQKIVGTKIVKNLDDDIKELNGSGYSLRLLGYMACNITFGIGFLTFLFSKKRQCLHDMTSNSIVILVDKSNNNKKTIDN